MSVVISKDAIAGIPYGTMVYPMPGEEKGEGYLELNIPPGAGRSLNPVSRASANAWLMPLYSTWREREPVLVETRKPWPVGPLGEKGPRDGVIIAYVGRMGREG